MNKNLKNQISSIFILTCFFLFVAMANYAMISYYSMKYHSTIKAKIIDIRPVKSKRSTHGEISLIINDNNKVKSIVHFKYTNLFQKNNIINVDVYKNLFNDQKYIIPRYGKMILFGPTLAYILDGLIIFLVVLFYSDKLNFSRNRKREESDPTLKNQTIIALIITLFLCVIYFYLANR